MRGVRLTSWWVAYPAEQLDPELQGHRVAPFSVLERLSSWLDDPLVWPSLAELYERISTVRLSGPSRRDVRVNVEPVLSRAFRRGEWVVVDLRRSVHLEMDETEGVHTRRNAIESPFEDRPRIIRRIVEKSFLDVRLVNTRGRPLAGRRYEVQLPDGRRETGRLGSDARIVRKDIDPGTALLKLLPDEGEAFEGDDLGLPTPDTTIDFRLVSAAGKALANRKFSVTLPDGSKEEGQLDAEGRFFREGVTPGDFEITLLPGRAEAHAAEPLRPGRAPGLAASAASETPSADAASATSAPEEAAELVPANEVVVTLVDASGVPLAGKLVEFTLPDGSSRKVPADARGVARLSGLTPGSCEVSLPEFADWRVG